MGETIDPNVIVADLIARSVDNVATTIADKPATMVRRAWHAIADSYKPYLEHTYRKVSSIKTFLKTNEPTNILDAYVGLNAEFGPETVDDFQIIEQFTSGKKIVVSAAAGRGKSMLLRYIATSLYISGSGVIPLFIELRSLNGITDKDILAYAHSTYSGDSNIKFSDFEMALKSGKFCLILDGFDEVDHDSRSSVESRILDIGTRYPNLAVIVSSRPDERRFSSWEKFYCYKISPMDLKQVREMISKCDYDKEVKRAFLKKLDTPFYNKHSDFLGTPLLATLLMLTYELNAEIPKTIHTFYENAFYTLARRHDAMKSQFLRKSYSDCTVSEFSSVFSAFCFLTYCQWDFQFSESEIIKTLGIAAKKAGVSEDPYNLLNDFIESICVLQLDGLEYTFVHRSFQEYFSALFLSKSPIGVCKKYLNEGKSRYYDNVLSMWFAMDKDRLERDWISETVEEVDITLNRKFSDTDLFKIIVEAIDLSFEDGILFHTFLLKTKFGSKVDALYKMCEDDFRKSRFHPSLLSRKTSDDSIFLKEIISTTPDGNEFFGKLEEAKKKSRSKRRESSFVEINSDAFNEDMVNLFGIGNYLERLREGIKIIRPKIEKSLKNDDAFLDEIFS